MGKLKRPRGKRRSWQKAEANAEASSAPAPRAASTAGANPAQAPHAASNAPPRKKQAPAELRKGLNHTESWPGGAAPLPAPFAPEPSALPTAVAAIARALAFERLTDIQQRCWPCCLSGRDTVGVAPTGSGKSLAFAVPLVERLREHAPPPPASPLALVLVPTRELAQQVAGVCERVLGATSLDGRVMALHGGEPRAAQRAALQRAPPTLVVVATPGRLLDLSTPGGGDADGADNGARGRPAAIDLSSVRCVVLDEADKLLLSADLREQVVALHARTHADRQTCLFTATLAAGLADAAAALVHERPLVVNVAVRAAGESRTGADAGSTAGASEDDCDAIDPTPTQLSVPLCIRQEVTLCAEHKKARRLLKLLQNIAAGGSGDGGGGAEGSDERVRDRRVLIFANKIKAVSFVAQLLQRHGVQAETLSSRLTQSEREAVLRRFASGSLAVLVSTDVAARGVHIDGLRYVVNWDFGTNLEQYVHRVGRTGRQGRAGTAYSFFSRSLRPLAPAAVALLRAHGQRVDQYLDALAAEAVEAAADERPPAADADERAPPDDPDDQNEPNDGDAGDSSDSEAGDEHSAQRWLAARLKSPITGMAPSFHPRKRDREDSSESDSSED